MMSAVAVLAALTTLSALALDGDSDQPVRLDADYIEIDFNTGERLYRGNVVLRQGSIRIDCDEMRTHYTDDDELDSAVCTGNPGIFRQQPEGEGGEMIGSAMTITYDRKKEMVTLTEEAKVVRGRTTVDGHLITYDLETEKSVVQSVRAVSSQESSQAGGASADSEAEVSPRPSIVIQPRVDPDD